MRNRLVTAGFFLALMAPAFPAYAVDSAVMPPPSAPAIPSSMPSSTIAPPPAMSPPPTVTPMSPTSAPGAIPTPPGKNDSVENMNIKVPDSVKDIVKRLDSNTTMTLDDLNSARQAVARIEALIDIEKHIADLEKVRNDREEGTMKSNSRSLAASIPASAIAPPVPSFAVMPQSMPTPKFEPIAAQQPMAAAISAPPTEVSRIIGSDGHYAALVKGSDGTNKTVYVGDHLPNGAGTVEKISASEVVIDQAGVKHILHVKNVDMVFGNTP